MGQYVDGFVIPIRKDRVEDYRKLAEQTAKIWKDLGALEYWECVGDDLEAEQFVSFTKLTQASPEETVIFAWVVYESREHRDAANAKLATDSRIAELTKDGCPFEIHRMAFGGFKVLVSE